MILLKLALAVFGLIFTFGVYPMTVLWPTGWVWHEVGQSPYLQMIIGIYFTLGVFLLMAVRNPLANRSLIWFTVWSSVIHAGIMAVQSFVYPNQTGHLIGDVPALLIVAGVLGYLMSRVEAKVHFGNFK